MTQFVKIPKQMILKHDGNTIKIYGAIVSHLRKNKKTCYPSFKRLTKLTGIKSRTSIAKILQELIESGWLSVTSVDGKTNKYRPLRLNSKFKRISINALLLSKKACKLYCVMRLLFIKKESIVKPSYIKKQTKITDHRTIFNSLIELENEKLINIKGLFSANRLNKWRILYGKKWTGQETLSVKTGQVCCKKWTGLVEKMDRYVVKNGHEVDYMEIELLEVDYVKYGEAKFSQHRKTHTNSDANPTHTNPDTNAETNVLPDIDPDTDTYPTDPNANTEQEEKEIFVAEPDSVNKDDSEEQDIWAAWGEPDPPAINRAIIRKNNPVYLSPEKYEKFRKAQKTNFNGKGDIVKAYVNHEIQLWDQKKWPKTKEELEQKFQKEIYVGAKVAKHFVEMTESQRERELELLAAK